MHRPQNILDSVSQCQQLPAPKGDGEGGSHTVHDTGFDLEKQKQKIGGEKAGWELYCENPSCQDILLHTLFQNPQKRRDQQRLFTALVQNITLSCCLRPSGLIEMAITACTLQNQQAKILAVVACSAILTYVTLVS